MSQSSTPTTTPSWPNWNSWQTLAVGVSLTSWFVGVFFLITVLGISFWGWRTAQAYLTALNLSPQQVLSWLEAGSKQTPVQTNGVKNILVLGVDTLVGRGNSPALTDTMMVVSLNFHTGAITLLPLPRDLWSPDYQTKINSLYWYGTQQQPSQPLTLPTQVVSSITGQPIHHTILVSLDQLSQVIDALGGVAITVERGFVDDQFPRPGVDVTMVRDPAILYERIEFVAGPTTMDGATALKYIRSRKSEGDEGDDVARSHRQQQVIAAMVAKLRSPQLWQNPDQLALLYQLYESNWAATLPIPELISTGRAFWPVRTQLLLNPRQLSVWPDDPQGLIWHPPVAQTQNQWVYIVREPAQLQSQVSSWFGAPSNSATASALQK